MTTNHYGAATAAEYELLVNAMLATFGNDIPPMPNITAIANMLPGLVAAKVKKEVESVDFDSFCPCANANCSAMFMENTGVYDEEQCAEYCSTECWEEDHSEDEDEGEDEDEDEGEEDDDELARDFLEGKEYGL